MLKANLHTTLKGSEKNVVISANLSVQNNECIALYGPSGSGKTSILRMLAGLLPIEKGSIIHNQQTWVDTTASICLPIQKRSIGFLFQEYALFPHMSVYQNIAYAAPKETATNSVKKLIDLLELNDLQDHKPHQLSGGQQQRVALGRAIARKPDILLLDEPLSALDLDTRYKLQDYLTKVLKEYDLSIILVSHNPEEILKLATRVYHLQSGKIINEGTPSEILNHERSVTPHTITGEVIAIHDHSLEIMYKENLYTIPYTSSQNITLGEFVSISIEIS